MPLRKLGGVEALAVYRANPYSNWPSREDADNRLRPICRPAFSPSFKLEYGEKVFTIGSCFARNIEKALSVRGFDVVTGKVNWPDDSVAAERNALLNNYGVASIANELRWALDPDHPYDPDVHIVELMPNRFVDLHIANTSATPYDTCLAYRQAITDVTRRVQECRVVIMTLGLAEQWFDNLSGHYLNKSPPRMLINRQPDRFEVHLLSIDEARDIMRAALNTLQAYCRPDLRVLLTVSPVPLAATFFDQDDIVTNCYSKSLLRTVAEHVAVECPMVDYFPSYESVTLSDPDIAWKDDQLHVRDEVVAANVERMIEAYRPESVSLDDRTIKLAIRSADEEIKLKNFEAAIAVLEPLNNAATTDTDFAVMYAELCLRFGRLADAARVIGKLPASASGWRADLLRAQLRLAHGEDATGDLVALAEKGLGRARILKVLIDAYVGLGRYDDALVTAKRWQAAAAGQAEPLRKIAAIHIRRGDRPAAEAALKTGFERNKGFNYVVDYAEFLIEGRRFQEAAQLLRGWVPETHGQQVKIEQLSVLLPSRLGADETGEAPAKARAPGFA